jgi:cytidylate kinase
MSLSLNLVTIDGPAASGKTSVSREVAAQLGWSWVSTGAFYRGLALAASKLNLDLQDELALANLCDSKIWSIELSSQKTRVMFDDNDVTDEIAQEMVGNMASLISRFPLVRSRLLMVQRDCRSGKVGLVAEGRDCGTVVFPEAPLKFYLTARSEDRALRRAQELGLSLEDMIEAQKARDKQDTNRKIAPLAIAENAMVIDTSKHGFNEVVDLVLRTIRG